MNEIERAAVFGATGGIGEALVAALEARNVAVTTLARRNANIAFDLTDEASIARAATALEPHGPQLILVATGVLTLEDGRGPERTYKAIDAPAMEEVFRLNVIGPALVAKHTLPLLPRAGRSMFSAISARVGSIGDNRLGGWHSYRASKAALNMLIRNLAIEMARTHPQSVICGLHPGTVETALSAPFRANLREGQLQSPGQSAAALLDVLDGLSPDDSGGVYDWRGERLPN